MIGYHEYDDFESYCALRNLLIVLIFHKCEISIVYALLEEIIPFAIRLFTIAVCTICY